MSKKESHLAMILSIINRISQNNLILKGWTVVSIPVFFVLSESSGHEYFIHLAYLITIVLWMFDGYLLFKQRLYMSLYNKVRKLDEADIDYFIDITTVKNPKVSLISSVLSKTLILFYGSMIVLIFISILLF